MLDLKNMPAAERERRLRQAMQQEQRLRRRAAEEAIEATVKPAPEPKPMWGIMAHRTGGSPFGAASAWCRERDRTPTRYLDRADAERQCAIWNESLATENVRYSVEPLTEADR